MIDMIETGKNLKQTLKDRHIKVARFCDMMNISPTAVHTWFRGESLPSIDNLFYMAELMECKVDDLVVYIPENMKKAA